jgi:hypothetical protein
MVQSKGEKLPHKRWHIQAVGLSWLLSAPDSGLEDLLLGVVLALMAFAKQERLCGHRALCHSFAKELSEGARPLEHQMGADTRLFDGWNLPIRKLHQPTSRWLVQSKQDIGLLILSIK